MTTKQILLDWDGVVRANYYDVVGEPHDNLAEHRRLLEYPAELEGESFVMHIDPVVLERLTAVAARPDVTMFWFSANGYIVPHIYAPIVGLPRWGTSPYASDEPGMPGSPHGGFLSLGWWKTEAALKHLEAGEATDTRVLWVDDNVQGDLQHHLAYNDPARRPRLSWIKPDSRHGLSLFELDLIDRWADDGEQIRWDTDREAWKARDAADRLAFPEDYDD